VGASILVHGHRGARAVFPENTLPGFLHAIEVGADALELDLAVTRDDVLVVCHDPILSRRRCRGPGGSRVIRSLSLRELRQWDCGAVAHPRFPKQKAVPGTPVPTLDEVFALAPRGRFLFNVETKISRRRPRYTPPPERFAELLLERIRAHRLERRVIVQSFDFRTLRAMKRLAPGIRLAALCQVGLRSLRMIAGSAGADIISPDLRVLTPRRVAAAHRAGLEVVPWTANRLGQWNRLIQAGVDGIITDDPGALIAYLKSRGLR
jgi:glycerophosphoryl diester phosphodiesterase